MASVYQHIPTHEKEPIIDGVMYPTMVFKEYLERIKTMDVRTDDVWLMSYPKAGIHWLKAIVYQIYNYDTPEGRGDEKPPGLDSFVLFAEYLEFATGKPSVDILPTIPATQKRFIATHLLPHTMPNDFFVKKPKTIHLVRNPKDTAVSLFHFMNRVPFFTAPESWESLLDDYLKGNVVYGKHDEYMKAWWKRRNEIDMMFISFEEMKRNPAASVKKIADYLDIAISDDTAVLIADRCAFDNLKSKSEPTEALIYRKGTTGEWKTKFTVAQSETFDAHYDETMKETDFKFDYE